ncbi:MAG: hypothetical protein WBO18_06040 [Gammaproteobacteria bacterium]
MLKHLKALSLLCFSAPVIAAGPLVLEGPNGHVPATYEDSNIVLNIETGTLGSLLNDEADQLVRDALTIWNDISTSTIAITLGNDVPVDIDETNFTSYIPDPFNSFINNDNDGLNPIVYDDDGSIIDAYFGIGQGTGLDASVVGFAASSILIGSSYYTEGFAVINGNDFLPIGPEQIKLIFAHEIGHYLGLDHTQANIDNTESLFDFCPSAENDYPLMYPYACRESQFTHPDDKVSLSMLYPAADFFQQYGQLTGRFVTTDGVAVKGANLWVENTTTGAVYSVVSDYLMQCTGFFALFLPPGSYTLHANSINNEFYSGSSVGPYALTPYDLSFQSPASTIGSVEFDAGGVPPAILNLVAGKAVDVEFRTDGSGTVTSNDTQVDLVQIYNSTETCAVTSIPVVDDGGGGGGGSPSLPLLAILLSMPALRMCSTRRKTVRRHTS